MNETVLLAQLDERFKKELPNHTFANLDSHFFISSAVLKEGFIGTSVERLVCSCIVDMYLSWNNYLQSLIMPNPHNSTNLEESNTFTDDEKYRFSQLISHALAYSSENALLSMKGKNRAEFINRASDFWEKTYKPEVIIALEKINKLWVEKSVEEQKKEPKHYGGTV